MNLVFVNGKRVRIGGRLGAGGWGRWDHRIQSGLSKFVKVKGFFFRAQSFPFIPLTFLESLNQRFGGRGQKVCES